MRVLVSVVEITEDMIEGKLRFLAESDQRYSLLYAAKDAHKEMMKLQKAKVFLEVKGTVAEREAHADCHPEVARLIRDGQQITSDFVLLKSERDRALTVIEVWRTVEASRRRS